VSSSALESAIGPLRFADAWRRRRVLELAPGAPIAVPPYDDLVSIRPSVDGPMSDEELADNIELIDWFMRRYPTPAQRLAFAHHMEKFWRGPAATAKR
jgi:hypothetical protein